MTGQEQPGTDQGQTVKNGVIGPISINKYLFSHLSLAIFIVSVIYYTKTNFNYRKVGHIYNIVRIEAFGILLCTHNFLGNVMM